MNEPLAWMVGGAQGSGVDTAANLFARACARAGLNIFGKREYYSNIMGKHSYFQVRVHRSKPVRASTSAVHLLATFDVETPLKHFRSVVPSGGIIYDPALVKESVDSPPNMEVRFKEELKTYLAERDRPATLEGVLEDAAARGVRLYPLPYAEMYKRLGEATGVKDFTRLSRTVNTMAVAASMALLKFDVKYLDQALQDHFGDRKKIVEMNQAAVRIVYEYMNETFPDDFPYRLEPVAVKEARVYLQGTQATALGKLYAGLTFQTYYPISPATDESVFLEQHENVRLIKNGRGNGDHETAGVVVVQTEDEIAAITMATGAAVAGARASTATSGPGFNLMVEGLGWAGINEVPIVVTLYQRGGPSTGLPTRTEQGDLWFAIHHGHSDFPRIVLASGDHRECFYDAIRAFNWAERYQVPVIHLIDKYLANSTATYPFFNLDGIRIDRGKLLDQDALERLYAHQAFKRFEDTYDGISPRSVPGQKHGIHWATGDEHDEFGHITEDVVLRNMQMEKRARKLEQALREITPDEKFAFYGNPDAKTLIISWGSNKGVILEAMEVLEAEGIPLAFLQVRLIWPFDRELFAGILKEYPRRIAVETNFSGQLAGLMVRETGLEIPHQVVKYNGRPIMLEELVDALRSIRYKHLQKVVLTHGI